MIKVALIGPESTGKSTLCKQLASHYDTVWVEEYAREYLEKHGNNYSFEDLLEIAKGQVLLEEQAKSEVRNDLLFVDTDMYVMKVWSEFVFGKCHPYIIEQLELQHYDLYLLCNTNIPWVKDSLREYPDLETRENLFRTYEEVLKNQSTPWVEISGNYEERFQSAIKAVDAVR